MPAASLAELADCWLAVEGRRLPAHSQVLAAQAGVLRDFVLTAREGGQTGKEVSTGWFTGSEALGTGTCLLHGDWRGMACLQVVAPLTGRSPPSPPFPALAPPTSLIHT